MTPASLLIAALFLVAGILFVRTGIGPLRYGRHATSDTGGVPVRLAWIIVAGPGLVLCPWVFHNAGGHGVASIALLALWLAAYGWRAVLYPILLRGTSLKRIPWVIVLGGAAVTVSLAYLNGLALAESWRPYPVRWLWSVRFLYGTMLFMAGMIISRAADLALAGSRSKGESGYVLPRGVLFEELSCPNYLGEIIMWVGWAIATWSTPGLACAAISFALLFPRAVSHHLWYRRTFPNYPPNRRAIVPFIL